MTEQERRAIAARLVSADRATVGAALRLGDGRRTRRHAVRSPLLAALVLTLALAVWSLTLALGTSLGAEVGTGWERDRAQASNAAPIMLPTTERRSTESVR